MEPVELEGGWKDSGVRHHHGCLSLGRTTGLTNPDGQAFCIDCNSYFTPQPERQRHWAGCWVFHIDCAGQLIQYLRTQLVVLADYPYPAINGSTSQQDIAAQAIARIDGRGNADQDR
jgi:hypothetical protein